MGKKIMICPVCEEQGLKSKVYPRGGSKTDLYCQPYYDEEGAYHHHDRNWVTEDFTCTNNHRWYITYREKCPSCDWPGEEPQVHIPEKEGP